MLERLKEARYRRRFGPERGPLVFRMEREMRRLPPAALSSGWIEWFWRQPPETWEASLERRRNGEWSPDEPGPLSVTIEEATTFAAAADAENAEIVAAIERNVATIQDAHGVFVQAADAIERKRRVPKTEAGPARPSSARSPTIDEALARAARACEAMAPSASPPTVSRPGIWHDWIAALPLDAREEAIQIRTLFATMERLQAEMAGALKARKAPDAAPETVAAATARIEALRPWVRACHREYEEIAEPFFERHGRPRGLGASMPG